MNATFLLVEDHALHLSLLLIFYTVVLHLSVTWARMVITVREVSILDLRKKASITQRCDPCP